MENCAAKLYGKQDLRLEEDTIPSINENEVLIALQSCGICGTDIHLWQKGGGCGDFVFNESNPMILGHESSGKVVKIGSKVKSLNVGDRVAIELGVPCGTCEFCKTGKINMCRPFKYYCLARYMAHHENFCYRLPDNVSYEDGAMVEPLSVCVRACEKAGIKPGSAVLILGAGTIGLCCMMVAKAMGASKICITDANQTKLDMAKTLGATHALLVDPSDNAKVCATKVTGLLEEMPQHTIDCVGQDDTMATAIYATRSGGVIAVVGLDNDLVTIPLTHAVTREIDIRGVLGYCNEYQTSISLLSSGQVNVKPLITDRFSLSNVMEAFNFALHRTPGSIKVMIDCTK